MLASSSHMYSSGQLRRYLQYFRKRLAWECPTKALVNIIQGHAIGQAFKNQRDREASPPDGERAASEFYWTRICTDFHGPLGRPFQIRGDP